jgi:AraC-like DNA-binding protein
VLFESPLVRVGMFRCPADHPRFGDSGPTRDFCFVFPRTAVWIQHEGRPPFVADATVVPLYNAGRPYLRRRISDEGDRTDWFGVAPDLLRDMLVHHHAPTADAERELFGCGFAKSSPRLFLRQRRVFDHVRGAEPPDALLVEESVVGILDDVLRGLNRGSPSLPLTKHRDLAESTRAHLSSTYARQDGLSEVARSVGASVFHLSRVFRRYAGVTLHRYRTELRLRRSLELLSESDDDILTIAMGLGYSGHSHFTGAFHRSFGITPSRFRALARARGGRAAREAAGDRAVFCYRRRARGR